MSLLEADADGPLVTHRPLRDDAKFDITAMIDLVFMMNIYFLVTTVTAKWTCPWPRTARRRTLRRRQSSPSAIPAMAGKSSSAMDRRASP